MSSRKYVGKNATQARHRTNRLQTDTTIADGVSPQSLQDTVTAAVAPLAYLDYVNAADAAYVSRSYVDQRDALNLLTTQIGVANGVAPLNASGQVPATHLNRVPVRRQRGPYNWTTRPVENASRDSAGNYTDKWIGDLTIPAPGSGFGIWRPLVLGRFEGINITGFGRAEILVRYGTTDIAHGYGYNGNDASDTQPYGFMVLPMTTTIAQTPAGWAETTSITMNVFLRASFNDTTVGLAGANTLWGFAQTC